jgi:hypothetical protein
MPRPGVMHRVRGSLLSGRRLVPHERLEPELDVHPPQPGLFGERGDRLVYGARAVSTVSRPA